MTGPVSGYGPPSYDVSESRKEKKYKKLFYISLPCILIVLIIGYVFFTHQIKNIILHIPTSVIMILVTIPILRYAFFSYPQNQQKKHPAIHYLLAALIIGDIVLAYMDFHQYRLRFFETFFTVELIIVLFLLCHNALQRYQKHVTYWTDYNKLHHNTGFLKLRQRHKLIKKISANDPHGYNAKDLPTIFTGSIKLSLIALGVSFLIAEAVFFIPYYYFRYYYHVMTTGHSWVWQHISWSVIITATIVNLIISSLYAASLYFPHFPFKHFMHYCTQINWCLWFFYEDITFKGVLPLLWRFIGGIIILTVAIGIDIYTNWHGNTTETQTLKPQIH